MSVCAYICVILGVRMYIYIYMRVCVCVCVCVCVRLKFIFKTFYLGNQYTALLN